MTTMIETRELGKKYGHVTALEDCTLSVPEGQLVALVGPNGAGKSTLLNLVVGLAAPTSGEVSVLDGFPAGSPAALDGIAFVAQDMPLYRNLSAVDLIHLTRNLNLSFDDAYARRRLLELAIPERPRTGKLSGGQRAQLALTLALARHPRLLVLDEPTAALDPLARHDFMATVMAAMVEDGVSVMLSSHVLAELERVADYLILISHGRVHLDGAVEELLGRHRLLTGPRDQAHDPRWRTIQQTSAGAQSHLLVELTAVDETPRGWEARSVSLEELTMAYLRGETRAPRGTDLETIR
jgi:ABC-2 type transport system ATP-binding protein